MPLSLASTVGRFIIQRRDDLDLKSEIGVEIYVLKFINIEVVCPMEQKTIPAENYLVWKTDGTNDNSSKDL